MLNLERMVSKKNDIELDIEESNKEHFRWRIKELELSLESEII